MQIALMSLGDMMDDPVTGRRFDASERYAMTLDAGEIADQEHDLVAELLVNRHWAPGDVYYACSIAQVIGRPALMRELTRVGLHSRPLMDWVLRIMANLLRDDELGPAEAIYKTVAALARVIPERNG